MPAIAILTGALSVIKTASDIYFALKATWSKLLTPEEKAKLAAEEDALFATPAWQPSGRAAAMAASVVAQAPKA